MNQVWRNYYGSTAPNYGARAPMSYYDGISNKINKKLSDALGYVTRPKDGLLPLIPTNGLVILRMEKKTDNLPMVL